MLGLEPVQLALVLLGACFIVAGLFGLFPMLSASSTETASANGTNAAMPRMTKAEKAPKPQKPAKTLPVDAPVALATAVAPEVAPAPLTVKPHRVESTSPVSRAAAEMGMLAPLEKKPVIEEPKAAAVVTPEPIIVSGLDQEVVDELFAELFALRNSVSTLTHEVRELRTEQKARRFILREVTVPTTADQHQKALKTSA